MKRIITILIILLVCQSSIAQITKKVNEESESTISSKLSIIHKKAIKEGINRNTNAHYNIPTQSRTNFSDNRTLDSLTTQEWDDNTNQWKPGIREQFTYDSDDFVDEAILSIWNSGTSSWQVLQKNKFTFDTNGNLILQLISYQFVPNVWVLGEKREFTFDSNNNLTLEEGFVWDTVGGTWLNSLKYELTYDTNQNLTLDIGYEWLANQWVNMYKDEYFYNGNILSSEVNSLWNFGDSEWELDKQSFFTFSEGNLILKVVQEYDDDSGIWSILNKSEYTYNASDNLELQILSTWDDTIDNYVFKYKDVYQFDSNGNRTIGIYSEWLINPGEWIEDYKDEYVFDLNYNLVDITIPFFYESALQEEHAVANNMVIGYFGFEKDNLVWEETDKWLFFYSNYNNPLGVSNFAFTNTLKVYPNPTNNLLVVESNILIDRVELYSLLGKKIMDIQTRFNAISLNDLASGVYIVKITSGMQSISKRIIKQ